MKAGQGGSAPFHRDLGVAGFLGPSRPGGRALRLSRKDLPALGAVMYGSQTESR